MPEEEEVAESLGISLEEYQKLLENIKGISFIDIDAFKQKIPELEEEDIFEFLAGASSQNDPIENYTLKELTEKLAEAMEVLSEKERLILALYYYEDLNMKEIARVLGYTEGRISQLHQQALIKLRTYLNIKF